MTTKPTTAWAVFDPLGDLILCSITQSKSECIEGMWGSGSIKKWNRKCDEMKGYTVAKVQITKA